VDHHACHRFWMTVQWNADVNTRAWLIGKPGHLGRGLVTEGSVWASAEQGRGELRFAWRRAGEGGVHAPVESLPAGTSQLVVDRRSIDAVSDGLAARDNAALARHEFAALIRQ
jgi:hypothetical protein